MWMRSTKAFNTHWKNWESRNLALKEQQYQILKVKDTRTLGTSLLIILELRVLVLTKRNVCSVNDIDMFGVVLLQGACVQHAYRFSLALSSKINLFLTVEVVRS